MKKRIWKIRLFSYSEEYGCSYNTPEDFKTIELVFKFPNPVDREVFEKTINKFAVSRFKSLCLSKGIDLW